MKTLKLNDYLAEISARKAILASEGVVLDVEACRNSGARRTGRKRSALQRAEARAKAAGIQPIISNY